MASKISTYIGACTDTEYGTKLTDFIESLGNIPLDKLSNLNKYYYGYADSEIVPGCKHTRYDIDDNNWFSVIEHYHIVDQEIHYRFTAFRDE